MIKLFKKKKTKTNTLSFKEKFQHFQQMIEANDEAHKAMGELADTVVSGKPFSRGLASKAYDILIEKTRSMIYHFNTLSNNRYENLVVRLEDIIGYNNKILSPRLFCPEGWDCPDGYCHVCEKVKKITYDIPYSYNLNQINDSYQLQVGSKMSRLGEIKNVLKIPVPEGFCLTVRFFEDIMKTENLRARKNKIFYGVDFEDIDQISQASHETQELFVSFDLPEQIKSVMLNAFDDAFKVDRDTMVSVRSSAIGEDSADHSFAGMHETVLNVGYENLEDACLEVLISKYSPQALVYRYISGLRDEDMPMSVGCMQMVNAVTAGVLYTSDPYNEKEGIIIQAVKGLGTMVVSGETEPQEFVVSFSENPEILSFKKGRQKYVSTSRSGGGIVDKQINLTDMGQPCITLEQITTLVRYAIKIESHFNTFQDIEWAVDENGKVFILQARNLITKEIELSIENVKNLIHDLDKKYQVIIDKGDFGSHGIASGMVHIINSPKDIYKFPRGGIIVAKKNLQELASLIHKASGVITDSGSTTGHLSIIARELNIPLLTNTQNATELLETGMLITLFAEEQRVYSGKVDEIIELKRIQLSNIEKFQQSPMYKIWNQVIKFILKLNLIDPNNVNFKPEACETIHDVIRFAHESSLKYMFSVHDSKSNISGVSFELDIGVPLDINVIDLGNGLFKHENLKKINKENINSEPFLALIKG